MIDTTNMSDRGACSCQIRENVIRLAGLKISEGNIENW